MSAQKIAVSVRPALTPAAARAVIAHHSRSFSLASLLLGPAVRYDAEALYAYCRRADDAIDLVAVEQQPSALRRLRLELDAIYAGAKVADPAAAAFQRLVFERDVPSEYPRALLDGLELDVTRARYATLSELYHYCWCVAGSVGTMMCHVLGVSRPRALVHAAHLGMAMQLTNICRDVSEDWQRGRLYVPLELLPGFYAGELDRAGSLRLLRRAVGRLLQEADAFYRSGDAGLRYLTPRARWAVATARRVYSRIGDVLRARDCDVERGRAIVATPEKLVCLAHAAYDALSAGRVARRKPGLLPTVRFPSDVLPV